MFIDIHTHLDQYDDAELPGVLQRAASAGVGAIVIAGVTVGSSARAVDLADRHEGVFAGVGAHPQDLKAPLTDDELYEIDRLAASDRVVTLSEAGLDYQPSSPPRDWQHRALRQQIEIARGRNLSVIWHMREATEDSLRILREERVGDLGAAAHYFQGTYEEAAAIIDLGAKISLAKPLLRLPGLQEVATRIPLSEIVLETDSFPQPFKKNRARWTEPKDVPLVAAKLAGLKSTTVEEVMTTTTANALTVLGPRGAILARHLASPTPSP